MTFRELREQAGFTNRGDLANMIGVDPGTIRHLDTGHVADPRYSTVEALATVLNTTTARVMLAIRQSVKAKEAA
jgi:predicted transcriptional regulator